jgi:RHS repeat-associated protein
MAEDLTGTSVLSYFPTYDGNGNITAWVNASGTVVARQRYDAFGNIIQQTGTAPSNYGFSTKPIEKITGLLYYGYRYYDPITGRWPSRDPIEESGGLNLHSFVGNDGVNWSDYLGLWEYSDGDATYSNLSFWEYIGHILAKAGDDMDDEDCRCEVYNEWLDQQPTEVQVAEQLACLVPEDYIYNPGDHKIGWAVQIFFVVESFGSRSLVMSRPRSTLTQKSNLAEEFGSYAPAPKSGHYTPDRRLPRTKHGDPIPDTDAPHSQLGRNRDGEPAAREWMPDEKGGITATRDI